MRNPFRYFETSPKIIRLTVMMYVGFPLSLRQVEDLLHERGIDICHETVRVWWNRFGPMFAAEIRKKRVAVHRNWAQCAGNRPRLRPQAHRRRQGQEGDHPLPQTVHRTRNIRPSLRHEKSRHGTLTSRLTSIGASKPLSLTGTEFGGARSVRRPLFLKLAGSRDDKR